MISGILVVCFLFSALPNVTVVNKACSLEVNGYEVDFLPYTQNPVEHLKDLEVVAKKRKNLKILFGHLAIHGAELNTFYHMLSDVVLEHDGDMVLVNSKLFKCWDKVFLGHYHGTQKIDNLEYIGSPLQLNFGEAFQEKHVIIYDMQLGNQEYIVNDFSPQHLILSEEEIPNYKIEKNFVRLNVVNKQSIELLDLKNSVQKKNPSSLEIIQRPKKEEKQVVEDAKSILHKEDEMIEKYVEEVDTGVLEKKTLVEFGKICIKGIALAELPDILAPSAG